jgi:hypothetical protein
MMRRNNVTTAFYFYFFFSFAYVRDSLLMVINDVDTAIPIVLPLFSLSLVFFFHGGSIFSLCAVNRWIKKREKWQEPRVKQLFFLFFFDAEHHPRNSRSSTASLLIGRS